MTGQTKSSVNCRIEEERLLGRSLIQLSGVIISLFRFEDWTREINGTYRVTRRGLGLALSSCVARS